jgi:hypothetical protein
MMDRIVNMYHRLGAIWSGIIRSICKIYRLKKGKEESPVELSIGEDKIVRKERSSLEENFEEEEKQAFYGLILSALGDQVSEIIFEASGKTWCIKEGATYEIIPISWKTVKQELISILKNRYSPEKPYQEISLLLAIAHRTTPALVVISPTRISIRLFDPVSVSQEASQLFEQYLRTC